MLIRHAALRHAATFIGVTEQPPNSNHGPLIDKWCEEACGLTGVFWCCAFQHAMFKLAGFNLPGGCSVGNLLVVARKNRWTVARPRKGDLACFGWNGPNAFPGDHIGIVERVLALRWSGGKFTGWATLIEGNTSAQGDPSGSQSNGGGVFRRRRWIRGVAAEFVRVPGEVKK